ncbi:hypothetical protein BF95_03225 [Sphingobium sp. Ant17]|nr:hypothetical protein BF95_03225 [Sphingobium sp. Ant17]
MPDHLDGSRLRFGLGDRLSAQHRACGAFSVEAIAFAMLIAQLSIRSGDLDDFMALGQKMARQPGSV